MRPVMAASARAGSLSLHAATVDVYMKTLYTQGMYRDLPEVVYDG